MELPLSGRNGGYGVHVAALLPFVPLSGRNGGVGCG